MIFQYREDQEYHREVLGKSMSGGRLMRAFNELFYRIHWDNIAWKPGTSQEPDYEHIKRVLRLQQPELVICFGIQAQSAIHQLSLSVKFTTPLMHCHHPNARHKTQQDLNDFAVSVRTRMLEHELLGGKNIITPKEALERNADGY